MAEAYLSAAANRSRLVHLGSWVCRLRQHQRPNSYIDAKSSHRRLSPQRYHADDGIDVAKLCV